MELLEKEINQQRNRLSRGINNLYSKYPTNLHQQADTLRANQYLQTLNIGWE